MSRRYPGTKPFAKEEKDVFFGRDTDIEKLLEIVHFEPLVLLYSKSGLGKSSLINAGVIPQLETGENNQIFTIRFTRASDDSVSPLANVASKIRTESDKRSLLYRLIPNENSLWYHLKKRQLEANENTNFYLFFDQFE